MNKNLQFILLGFGAVIAIQFIFGRTAEQKKEDKALGFTEETGIIGDLGAATNRASGGVLADFGSFLGLQGSKIFSFFETGKFQ